MAPYITMHMLLSLVLFIYTQDITAQKLKGNKNVIIEDRDIDDFNAIIVKADFEVELFEDETPSMSIEADENLLPYIKTEVRNGTLEIYQSQKIYRKKTLKIKIGVTDSWDYLETRNKSRVYASYELHTHTLTIRGRGNSIVNFFALNATDLVLKGEDRSTFRITAEVQNETTIELSGHNATFLQLTSQSLRANLFDSSNLKISGTADDMSLKSQDNGNYAGKEFLLGFADVIASGTTDTEINVSELITIDLQGKAELYLYDEPKEINIQKFSGKCTLFKK